MADKSSKWHGIPRQDIPWYPTVNADTCIGCELCFVTCGRNVFEIRDRKSVVAHPFQCMVGCSTCAIVCPVEAISFPARDLIWKTEREHKIFRIVREEARAKRTALALQQARAAAEEALSQRTTQVRMEVSGEFGEKRFLVKLEELIRDRPYDIINLQLQVPTVKGAWEKAPSFMSFDVTSTEQEDIQSFLPQLRALIRDNGLVLVSEHKA
jgi:NAD-dependent dihydropyrimidine dehydrogenase PreA subunit